MHQFTEPFRAAEAVESGLLTFRELRRFHTAVYPGVWIPRGMDLSPARRARAAWLWSRRQGVPAGISAAALWGAKWIDPPLPAELIHRNQRSPTGLTVRNDTLLPGETQLLQGMRTTTAARTLFDLGRRLPLLQGLQRMDALMNATGTTTAAVQRVIDAHPGVRGLRQLRETLALADGGAESPYESLTRLMLVQRGFPVPATQIEVLDEYGIVARIDMGWRRYRVGVDFDGAHHWTDSRQRTRDVERYARLPELDWIDIRTTSGMLFNTPERFFDRVGKALISRGCPKTW